MSIEPARFVATSNTTPSLRYEWLEDRVNPVKRSVRPLRKAMVAVVGGTVTVTGIVLIPLPGPGTLITLGGLAILGTEFPTAQRAVDRAKSAVGSVLGRRSGGGDTDE